MSFKNLENISQYLRESLLKMCIDAKKGHVTSSLSCVEILVSLYYGNIMKFDPKNPEWSGRDKFILSKGQASPLLYTILADLGFYDKSDLNKWARSGGKFAVHLQKSVPGLELTVGSLGQGFGVAAGMALAHKMNRELNTVYAVLGDGECYEGSVWETAMFAAHHRLNNLVTIVDRNYMCTIDFTEDLLALEPMDKKWEAFGFNVVKVNGHSFDELMPVLQSLKSRKSERPTVIIADTVKGEGVPTLCYNPSWHAVAPSGDVAEQCLKELRELNNNE